MLGVLELRGWSEVGNWGVFWGGGAGGDGGFCWVGSSGIWLRGIWIGGSWDMCRRWLLFPAGRVCWRWVGPALRLRLRVDRLEGAVGPGGGRLLWWGGV